MFNKLPELDERQRKVIRRLTKSIVNQMMHDPINRIKELAGEENGSKALDMFTHIFALEEQLEIMTESHNESGASQELQPIQEVLIPTIAPSQEEEEQSKIPLVQVSV
ncbi:Glutamyl-tRNA reductase [compost metagenome]